MQKNFKIKGKFIRLSLLIQIAWLRFRLLKLPPQEYIYTYPPSLFFPDLLTNETRCHRKEDDPR